MEVVTCRAPANIAAIKYWGKRDEKLILPLNDSISVTISSQMMCAKTTVATSPDFVKDRIWLNGREESMSNPRLINCLTEIREMARKNGDPKAEWKVHICSQNNFPTAAGLASSAAGYACLVYALGNLFGVKGDLSKIARRGSGSACRSIHGGFVVWKMGEEKDGSDSMAKQIAPAAHWPEMRVLILVVSAAAKGVGSSGAMQRSVTTSEYLKASGRAVARRATELTEAILRKDFDTFARITMKDSNRLHAICLDTYPPVQYLNDTSHFIIRMVHLVNEHFGRAMAAYSFDAGPNACLFLLRDDLPLVLSLVHHFLPPGQRDNGEPYFRGEAAAPQPPPQDLLSSLPLTPRPPGALDSVILAPVGDGPEVLPPEDHLLTEEGLPRACT